MKTRLVVLFLVLIPVVDLLYSCCDCDVETAYFTYSHKALFIKNLDNSGKGAIASDSLELNKNAYGIRFSLEREKNGIAQNLKQANSIFVQPANAFSCLCPPDCIYLPSDSIVSINIFTLKDFDDLHSENSDITEYFRVKHSYATVEEYVANIYYTFEYDIEAFSEMLLEFDLLLMTAPTAGSNQQFKVRVVLSDGRVLEQQTSEIKLL